MSSHGYSNSLDPRSDLTTAQEESQYRKPATSSSSNVTPREPDRFCPTVEAYEQLLANLKDELANPTKPSYKGKIKYNASDNLRDICEPLSTGDFSHGREPHQVSDVEDLPRNHPLRPLLAYAKSESLSARVSFKHSCPSYRSLVVGNLQSLADERRLAFEYNPNWSEDGPSVTRALGSVASPTDRWTNQAKRIARHHIQLVEDSLLSLRIAHSLKGEGESDFVFDS